MNNNKVLVKIYVPIIDEQFDIFLPLNKNIYTVINLLVKAINEFSGGYYVPNKLPLLYDKLTAKPYDINLSVKDSGIVNATELILL